jgi:hypothetical protein
MDAIVFLPGLLGSRLSLRGEEIWPPTVTEIKIGYDRIDALLDPAAIPTGIIENVWCHEVYKPILQDLHAISTPLGPSPARHLELFAYDWRVDIRETSTKLGSKLSELAAGGSNRIAIVAHSMGGLISRLLLEDPANRTTGWYPKIELFAAFATPHLGAPVAIARAMGLEGTLGLSGKDIQRMGANARYPALYQLLPAPGQQALWDTARGGLVPLDFYDPAVATRIGLDDANLKVAQATHARLDVSRKSANTRYVWLGGSGHSTCIRVELSGSTAWKVDAKEAGDGTVPLWSAISGITQNSVSPGEHSQFFASDPIRSILYRLFGRTMPAMPFAAEGKPRMKLSTDALVYGPNKLIEVLLIPIEPTRAISGSLEIKGTVDAVSLPLTMATAPIPVSYAGPPISMLRATIAAPSQPGQYEIGFTGSHSTEPVESVRGAATFAVSAAA